MFIEDHTLPYNFDEIVQAYMGLVYQDSTSHQIRTQDEIESLQASNICTTYGELNYYSALKIFKKLNLRPNDTLLDLGSGLGKFALQAFIQTEVGKVVGIEAQQQLYLQSLKAVQILRTDFDAFWKDNRDLIFLNENFLESDWYHANIIYSCSTCFTLGLLEAIGHSINKQPHVQQVLSLRPIPTLKIPLKDVFAVECSWDSALCYHYSKLIT